MKKKHLVFRRMICDMFRISPGMTTLYCLFDILHAGGYVLVMLCTEKLFDSVPLLVAGSPLSVSLRPLLFLILATVFFEVANSLSNFHIEHLPPKILSHFYKRIYTKASHISPIDYVFFQTPAEDHTLRTPFQTEGLQTLPPVEIAYFYADADPCVVPLLAGRARGLVIREILEVRDALGLPYRFGFEK